MNISVRARFMLGVALAVTSVVVAVTPAAAETVTVACHGTCGAYNAYDDDLANQGARCVYNTSGTPPFGEHLINKIVVRPPQMSGHYPTNTRVGWQFKIQRWRTGIEDPGHKSIVYTSSWQTAQASTTHSAYLSSGFAWRTWNLSEDAGYADFDYYRVFIVMRWWHDGSVVGHLTFRYDWYRERKGTHSTIENGWCGGAYPDPG